jgi:hypothetical protein
LECTITTEREEAPVPSASGLAGFGGEIRSAAGHQEIHVPGRFVSECAKVRQRFFRAPTTSGGIYEYTIGFHRTVVVEGFHGAAMLPKQRTTVNSVDAFFGELALFEKASK